MSDFLHIIENDPHTIHFFKNVANNSSWPMYTAHGAQAKSIAQLFYKTSSVEKRNEQGLETLVISKKLLVTILYFLIEMHRCSIKIWRKSSTSSSSSSSSVSSVSSIWTTERSATPGNVQDLEVEFGRGALEIEKLSSGAVIACVCVAEDKARAVGVALVRTSLRSL